jgi:hypothetical protein
MSTKSQSSVRLWLAGSIALALIVSVFAFYGWRGAQPTNSVLEEPPQKQPQVSFQPRRLVDMSAYTLVLPQISPWPINASLEEIAAPWRRCGYRFIDELDMHIKRHRDSGTLSPEVLAQSLLEKASFLNYEGEAGRAYQVLEEIRTLAEGNDLLKSQLLYTIIYCQGVTALRRGETDNCIMCRGESSCILPISPAAVHTNPAGSRLAIRHFTEYLTQFPNDLEVQWLLNIAHMTLGEHPDKVDPRFRISLDLFNRSEFGIGKFRDIGHLVGIDRLNQGGGAIMDDFDNDGLLDLVFTSWDPTKPMVFYRNKGDGTFEDRTEAAGLSKQLGGLNCVQADYNNDGFLDIFIIRGAWLSIPMPPTLLRNNGNGTFTDVTAQAGLLDPVNSISAVWADYDNDGFLDLFICCEGQPNRLYHNRGNGTFEEVAARAGLTGDGTASKGAAWIDFDNDGYPDLFVNNLAGTAKLYRNNGNGTFTDVTTKMGIDGPLKGFSCWAWDFDNDGWPDIFATSYDRTIADVVLGLTGKPHGRNSNKLYRNMQGKGFKDVTKEMGLDLVFSTMGSNFGDFDNDGFLDMYLGTGDPQISSLVPNRMLRNLGGKRFVEITGSSGTGHLQKGHGVACGDWDRDGNIDIAIEMGGALPGDQYHNVLFQNPGQGNNSITVKLIGQKTNRSAIGARIKLVTAETDPLTVYRYVTSGSSFGGNPLEQTIGTGKADRIALLEVYWPTTKTTQTFRDVKVGQYIEITEFAKDYRTKDMKRIPLPK